MTADLQRPRVALVTESSRRLGDAIARRLARGGLAVAVNDLHGGEQALAVVGAIREWDRGGLPGRRHRRGCIGLTRSWARELAHLGITVNTVAPGFVPVERHANAGDEVRSAYISSVPAGRIGTPENIAQLPGN